MKLYRLLLLLISQAFYCQLVAEPKKFKTTYKRHRSIAKKKPMPQSYQNSSRYDDRCYICCDIIEHINQRERSMPSQRGYKCAHKLCLKALLEELTQPPAN